MDARYTKLIIKKPLDARIEIRLSASRVDNKTHTHAIYYTVPLCDDILACDTVTIDEVIMRPTWQDIKN